MFKEEIHFLKKRHIFKENISKMFCDRHLYILTKHFQKKRFYLLLVEHDAYYLCI